MLIEFRVGNFLSFKEVQTLRMIGVDKNGNSFQSNQAFIYGPNGSGKSNFIKAIKFSRMCILKGSIPRGKNLSYRDVNNIHAAKEPTYFEYKISTKGRKYSYGFEIDFNGNYHSEWLYQLKKSGDECIFEISFDGHFSFKGSISNPITFLEFDIERGIVDDIRLKSITNEDPRINDVFQWFYKSMIIRNNEESDDTLATSDHYIAFLKKYLQYFDTGITDIKLQRLEKYEKFVPHIPKKSSYKDPYGVVFKKNKNRNLDMFFYGGVYDSTENVRPFMGPFIIPEDTYRVLFTHSNGEKTHDAMLFQESKGTIKIIQLLTMISNQLALNEFDWDDIKRDVHGTIVIDEIECSINAVLIRELIRLFKEENLQNIQLIVTTHESRLLVPEFADVNSVWFIDNSRDGTDDDSRLYSLRSFEGKIINYDSMYLEGRFRATPIFKSYNKGEDFQ